MFVLPQADPTKSVRIFIVAVVHDCDAVLITQGTP